MDNTYSYSPVIRLSNNCKQQNIVVYPNPAKETITIANLTEKEYYYIYNSIGQLIRPGKARNPIETIHTGQWSNGVYLLKTNNQLLKFVKEQPFC